MKFRFDAPMCASAAALLPSKTARLAPNVERSFCNAASSGAPNIALALNSAGARLLHPRYRGQAARALGAPIFSTRRPATASFRDAVSRRSLRHGVDDAERVQRAGSRARIALWRRRDGALGTAAGAGQPDHPASSRTARRTAPGLSETTASARRRRTHAFLTGVNFLATGLAEY